MASDPPVVEVESTGKKLEWFLKRLHSKMNESIFVSLFTLLSAQIRLPL